MAVTRPRVRSNPKLHALHRERHALLRASFAGDKARLALALEGDEVTQQLYQQAMEIAAAPNPWEHALRILESLCPGPARTVSA